MYLLRTHRGADKSLARPGRKQARNMSGTFPFLKKPGPRLPKSSPPPPPARQGTQGNSRHSDRNITCFLPGRAKDLSAPM